ncbi:hypothetical protein [Bradyrhizobium sp.]|uniref:hypothetical protein n=1 Tax=Bradyrhizobium sp. TaxID=376 RepID=UPI0025C5E31C|nr:hypothetical protein [Bradyrhizobium sp.]
MQSSTRAGDKVSITKRIQRGVVTASELASSLGPTKGRARVLFIGLPLVAGRSPLLLLFAQEHLSSRVRRSASTSFCSLVERDLALVAQFPGNQLARTVADAKGDIVAGDVEDTTSFGA